MLALYWDYTGNLGGDDEDDILCIMMIPEIGPGGFRAP